jgi:hypothetical protein
VRRSRADPTRPRRHKTVTREQLILALEDGCSKTECARRVGVNVSTLWRWTRTDKPLADALADAHKRHQRELAAAAGDRTGRPRVRVDRRCPYCCSQVGVLTGGGRRFWRCPACGWKSWRPRARGSCGACGGWLVWSCSRKSISCATCRRHWLAPSPASGGG